MKRVKQISFDILVGENINGDTFADEVANFLGANGYEVLGASFQEDMTEVYEKYGYSMDWEE